MAIYLQGVGASSFLVTYAGTTLTDHVRSVTINMAYDEVDVTAMGAVAHAVIPGLRDDSVTLEFYQDFAASSVDVTLNSYLGSTSGATLVIQSSGSTVSATNPKWTVVSSPFTYEPLNAAVGEASTTSVTFKPVAGQSITRATS